MAAAGGSLKTRISRLIGFENIASGVPRAGLAAVGLLFAAGALIASSAFHTVLLDSGDDDPAMGSAPEPPSSQAPSSGSYIEDLHSAGLTDFTVDQLIALKIQGVTGDYVRRIRAAGLNPTADQLIAMKIHGISPDYVRSLQSAVPGKLSADQCIAAKIHGITPEFVQNVRSQGFSNLTLDKLIALKAAGVF